MGFVDELKWRGILHDIMPGTEALLNQKMIRGYIGFDPTADSLGVGNLVQVMTLLHFQQAGHQPVALVGGATGMVGDPSGKSQERNLLSADELQHNLECQRKQLEKFLDFNCGANSAEIVNNYDWFKNYLFLDFIREVGKHISVNYMLAKESVQLRMESGMSFTEFTYQLIQGYDFYYLWKHFGVQLQMGGSDQWGNIVTGTELIRRKDAGEAFAITTQLIKKADGTKFGKTEGGNIWLDPKKTSPYKFYQFWLNASDEDAKKWIYIFTLFDREKIENLIKAHEAAPHLRLLQKALSEDICLRVHGKEEYIAAVRSSEILFGKSTIEALRSLDNNRIEDLFDGVPVFHISRTELNAGIPILDLLAVHTQILPSKSEAKKMIQANGIALNMEKETDSSKSVTIENLINGKYIIVRRGKKEYSLISVE